MAPDKQTIIIERLSGLCAVLVVLISVFLGFVILCGSLVLMVASFVLCAPIVASMAIIAALWGKYGDGTPETDNQSDEALGGLQPRDEGPTLRPMPFLREPGPMRKGRWPD